MNKLINSLTQVEGKIKITPNNINLLEEMKSYNFQIQIDGSEKLVDSLNTMNHHLDALRYSLIMIQQNKIKLEDKHEYLFAENLKVYENFVLDQIYNI